MTHKKVLFKGEQYWLHSNDYIGYKLSPLDHFDEKGNLLVDPFTNTSYAVVINGYIMRHSEVIGKESELEDVNEV